MKKIAILLFCILAATALPAAASADLDTEVLDAFLQYIPGDNLPAGRAASRQVFIQGVRMDPTLSLLHAVRNWDNLRQETRNTLSRYIEVSPLRDGMRSVNTISTEGCPYVINETDNSYRDSTHFRAVYTTSLLNEHRVTSAYVDTILQEAESTWTTEVSGVGLPAPLLPSDNKIRIYLCNLIGNTSGILGRTFTQTVNYSNYTAQTFIELDNDYLEITPPNNASRTDYAAVVFAHEFFHAIQFGINFEAPSYWLLESNAVWMEEEVYPDIDDYLLSYVGGRFQRLETSIDYFSFSDVLGYGASIFFRHITENEMNRTFINNLWQTLKTSCINLSTYAWCNQNTTEIPLLDSLLAAGSTDVKTVYRNFNVANYTKNYQDGTESYFPSVPTNAVSISSGSASITSTLDHLGAKFYKVTKPSGSVAIVPAITFSGASTADWRLSVIRELNAGGFSTSHPSLSSNAYSGELTGFGNTFNSAVIIVDNVHSTSDNKAFTLNLDSGTSISAPAKTLSSATLSSSSSNVAAHLLKVQVNISGTMTSLVYSNAGTGQNTGSLNWTLYRDNDANGIVGAGDTALKTISSTGQNGLTFTGLSTTVTAGNTYHYLLAFSSAAAAKTTGLTRFDASSTPGHTPGGAGTSVILLLGFAGALGACFGAKAWGADIRKTLIAMALAALLPAMLAGCGGGGGGGGTTTAAKTLKLQVDPANITIVDGSGNRILMSGAVQSGPTISIP